MAFSSKFGTKPPTHPVFLAFPYSLKHNLVLSVRFGYELTRMEPDGRI